MSERAGSKAAVAVPGRPGFPASPARSRFNPGREWIRGPASIASRRILIVAAGLALALGAPIAAAAGSAAGGWMLQSFSGDGVKGTLTIPGDSIPRFGFVPVRVDLANDQPRELQWQAVFTVHSSSNSAATSAAWTVRLPVAAKHTGTRWILVPTADAGMFRDYGGYYPSYTGMSVTLTGSGLPTAQLQFFPGTSGRSGQMVPWAVSTSLESGVRSRIARMTADPSSPRARQFGRRGGAPVTGPVPLLSGPPNLTPFDLTQSLGDWRIWSPFARVVMRADEYAVLLPANRFALRNWVALGGRLYLFSSPAAGAGREFLGTGAIVHLAQEIEDRAADADGLFTPAGIFDPTLVTPSNGDLTPPKGGLADKVPRAKNVGDWLVWFFVGFAALIGPINLYVIAPARRRHWLFFSLPAISVAAVAVLIAAIYLQDGVGGDGARRAMIVLLPEDNQAAVFQEQVSRTGLLFNSTFSLPEDAICANVATEDSAFQTGRTLQYDRQQTAASGDWFRGRTRQAQHLRQLVPTRARVELVGRAPDGAPIVQSTASATLHEFCYLESAGKWWEAEKIPTGVRVTLAPKSDRTEVGPGEEVSPGFRRLIVAAFGGASSWRPGHFVARAEASELAPIATLPTVRWNDSAVMITGALRDAMVPDPVPKEVKP